MQTIKLDLLKFTGAKTFRSKDSVDHIAIPLAANNVFMGEKGLYCSLTLMDNKDGVDQYGNDGFVTQDIGKERRLAGEKGPILGNWKHLQPQQPKPAPPKPPIAATDDSLDEDDEIPF